MNTEFLFLHVQAALEILLLFLFILSFSLLLRRFFLWNIRTQLWENPKFFFLLRLFELSFVFHIKGDSQVDKISGHFLSILIDRWSFLKDLHKISFRSPRMRINSGCLGQLVLFFVFVGVGESIPVNVMCFVYYILDILTFNFEGDRLIEINFFHLFVLCSGFPFFFMILLD